MCVWEKEVLCKVVEAHLSYPLQPRQAPNLDLGGMILITCNIKWIHDNSHHSNFFFPYPEGKKIRLIVFFFFYQKFLNIYPPIKAKFVDTVDIK